MSTPPSPGHSWRRNPWFWTALLVMALFLGLIARYYHPSTGWSSLISIGEKIVNPKVTALHGVQHHVQEGSYGYDGQFYVQLALHPLLGSDELEAAIDDPAYRARRMLLPWSAWLLGVGQPDWIVQAYALLNVVCWLVLAVVLWRWLPPVNAANFLRWAGILFAHGVGMSVRHALTDAPSLLLLALGMLWWEKQQHRSAMGALAAATLAKETAVLAAVLWVDSPPRGWRWWGRMALVGILIITPLLLWMGYVRWRFGAVPSEEGLGNFALPLAGLMGKWSDTLGEIGRDGWSKFNFVTLLTVLALTVQVMFFLLRWRAREAWWRVGAVFATLGLIVAQPVWEGHPGAATRVLLPMMVAFNLLVPRARRWLPVLIAGNLSIAASVVEFSPPRANLLYFKGEPELVVQQSYAQGAGWYLPELKGWKTRRWALQTAELDLHNAAERPVALRITAHLAALSPRQVELRLNGLRIWQAALTAKTTSHELPFFNLPPGQNRLEFVTNMPAERPAMGDERDLSFCVWELVLEVQPARTQDLPARN
jgi:hypothetical protein